MRYLAIVSFSFAAGVFGAVYGLPEGLWLPIAAALEHARVMIENA